MIRVSATNLRKNLFDYLDKVNRGEIIVIQRNNREIARLLPMHEANWRERMSIRPKLRVSADDFIEPVEDTWEDYI